MTSRHAEPREIPSASVLPELGEIIRVTLRVGTLLARSGAAAFRVREAMQRTAAALGVQRSEFVVAVDSISASVFDAGEFRTQVVRLPPLGVDMNLLSRTELLTRALGSEADTLSSAELQHRLDALEAGASVYPRWLSVPSLGVACAAFCAAGHGSALQIAAAFVGAAAGHALRLELLRRRLPLVSIVVVCAFVSCFMAKLTLLPAGWLASDTPPSGVETLASVLYLIPGVPLVTSLIDLLQLDISCGLSRAGYAVVILGGIASGVFGFFAIAGALPW
ncbi:MAG: threonine/serine exporter family protein [Polyangiaceae bacterium]